MFSLVLVLLPILLCLPVCCFRAIDYGSGFAIGWPFLRHGYYTPSGKKVSAASIFLQSLSYKVNPLTGYIDYKKLEEKALDFIPKILICGGNAYPREWDYERFRQIADKCGAVLMCGMAQICGLVAAQEVASPFDYCDIVTSTTHKSLRGPRGDIIFCRRGRKSGKQGLVLNHGEDNDYDFEEKIKFALFPSLQGGPHNNHIAAFAVALKDVVSPEYKVYMQQLKKNAQALPCALLAIKCRLVTGGYRQSFVAVGFKWSRLNWYFSQSASILLTPSY